VTKLFGFKTLAMGAAVVMSAALAGCNPEEPAKPVTPPPSSPPAAKAPAKPEDTKTAAPAPTPAPKKEEEKK
jgi:hypothetical protein